MRIILSAVTDNTLSCSWMDDNVDYDIQDLFPEYEDVIRDCHPENWVDFLCRLRDSDALVQGIADAIRDELDCKFEVDPYRMDHDGIDVEIYFDDCVPEISDYIETGIADAFYNAAVYALNKTFGYRCAV